MLDKVRNGILSFINSAKDTPVLAGFSVGFYLILFYYSRNFGLANSFQQLLFFSSYYILFPVAVMVIGYWLMSLPKLMLYRRNFLFFSIIGFFSFFLIQLNDIGFSKKIAFAGILVISTILSIWLKNYYKLLIVLLIFMSTFNIRPIAYTAWVALNSSNEWKKQPDDIEHIIFKRKPNIYYIQPDGYTSFSNLRKAPYNYDNSAFEKYLKESGFTMYDNFRSNYFSTLLSNSSMFSMKHHYVDGAVDLYAAREIIVGDNPVLSILKKNGYKTHFLSEKSYLIMNRPKMGYDYCNIDYSELSYIRDGWASNEPLFSDFKKLPIGKNNGNFYFIEKLSPNHIEGFEANSSGIDKERKKYLERLTITNKWLETIIDFIQKKDPDGLIVIAADHGGFVGFTHTQQSLVLTNKPELAGTIYGAHLSIKWNNPDFKEYERGLTSSVNLFRTVFAFLSQDRKYLDNLQENSSYIRLHQPKGLYQYFDNEGKAVFRKAD